MLNFGTFVLLGLHILKKQYCTMNPWKLSSRLKTRPFFFQIIYEFNMKVQRIYDYSEVNHSLSHLTAHVGLQLTVCSCQHKCGALQKYVGCFKQVKSPHNQLFNFILDWYLVFGAAHPHSRGLNVK
ncbi:UNVERIFIED_CONTAM: hypothetical protein K2H54_045345 [Gekko kuhli]